MKKSLLALLAVPLLFTSCYININTDSSDYSDYDNESKYQIGDAEITGEIESLNIDWTAGDITLNLNDSDKICFEETASKSIRDDMKLRYYYDAQSKSLEIKYCRPKTNIKSGFSKNLSVTLPAGTELKVAKINCVSGEITSKNIPMDSVEVNKTAGDLAMELPGTSSKVEVKSTSSDIMIESGFVKDLVIASTSGNIDYYASDDAPDSININSTSGCVNLYLPENTGFTLKVSNIWNKVKKNDFSTTQDNDKYIYKDGKKKYEIKITSGKIFLFKNQPACCK